MKYQSVTEPDVIVEAVQFEPNKGPWPEGVIPWPKNGPRPRDMTWGYMDTVTGRVHVMATDYIVDIVGNKRVYHREYFEANFQPVIDEEKNTHWLAYTMGPAASIGALIYDGKDEDRMLIEVGRACLSGRRMNRIRVYRNGKRHVFVLVSPEEQTNE